MGRPKGSKDSVIRGTNLPPTPFNLLMRHVRKTRTCWVYKGVLRCGYGRLDINGKTVSAHRLSYELFVGKIPDGLIILHKCDNKACVKPDHLAAGTQKDNMQDCVSKKRFKVLHGDLNGHAKLTTKQVKIIKEKLKKGYFGVDLAEMFNVSPHVICKINVGKNWRHI